VALRWSILMVLLVGCVSRAARAPVTESYADRALPAYVYAGGPGGEIQIFKLDRISGKLSGQGSVPAGRTGALIADRQGRFLYAASEGEVTSFAIRANKGTLQSLGRTPTRGGGTVDLALHRNGKYLLASNEKSGNVVVLPVRPEGGLYPATAYSSGTSPHAVALNPALDFAFVLNPGAVTQFAFNTGTGILTPSHERPVALPARSAPSRLVFHPSGKLAYILEEGSGQIAGYAFEATSGTLSVLALQTIALGAKAGRLHGADLALTPNGRFLYAVERGHDVISCFRVDGESGALTPLAQEESHGGKPRALAMSEGKLGPVLLVAHERTLASFNVNSESGALTFSQAVPLHGGVTTVAVATVRE
jgi:6-phosphogluconolactonase